MKFNENGYLDGGFCDIDLKDLNNYFVDKFESSSTRRDIIEGYHRFMKELKGCGIDNLECWIDGSFSTRKTDPNDIDMVLLIDRDSIDSIPFDKRRIFLKLFSPEISKNEYRCDAYILARVDDDHKDYGKYISQRNYWEKQFGTDRNDVPKGMLRIRIEGEVS